MKNDRTSFVGAQPIAVEGRCSIIIPVYNRENSISETVQSCVNQEYPSVEIILVDDGSTDSSLAACEKLACLYSRDGVIIRVYSQENAGACEARNRGLCVATGEFILFLDSDDLIPANKLSRQIAGLKETGADCAISDYRTIDENGLILSEYSNDLEPLMFIKRFRSPSNSAIIMRASTIPHSLRWNKKLKRGQDTDFLLRYLSLVREWVYIKEPLYYYRLHPGPRISDTYRDGMQYARMFASMVSHLIRHSPPKVSRSRLIFRYGLVLTRGYLKDTLGDILPRRLKEFLKALVSVGGRARP